MKKKICWFKSLLFNRIEIIYFYIWTHVRNICCRFSLHCGGGALPGCKLINNNYRVHYFDIVQNIYFH